MPSGSFSLGPVQIPPIINEPRVPVFTNYQPPVFQFGNKQNVGSQNNVTGTSANPLVKEVVNIPEDDEGADLKKKMKMVDDTFRSIKGVGTYGSETYPDLSIFRGAKFLNKFQVPDFEKYDGSTIHIPI